MTTALVTGATGHIGAHLVRELLDRGYQVRCLVRVGSDLAGLRGLDVQLHHGDILRPGTLDDAVRGAEMVFHCAAVYKNWAPTEQEILRPAVEGTTNVLRACARHRVRRVVMTSSSNAVGFSGDANTPLDESHWNTELHLPYVKAKVMQERGARSLAEELGLELVTVLPTGVLGPLDYRITPTTAYVRDVLAGRGPLLPGWSNLVHVRDVAIGHVLAAERGEPGGRYLIGGDNIDAAELQPLIAELTGNKPSVLGAPRWLLMLVAGVIEFVAGIRGAEPSLTRDLVRTAAGRHALFDCSRAHDELGLEPRSPREILADTHAWLVRMGQLEPSTRVAHAA